MIPSNTPTTDQSNVYYSNKSLLSRIGNFIDEDKYKDLGEKIEEYYLPWYVLDESSAPNSFIIDVYRRDSKVSINSIVLTSDGVMYETPQMPIPIFTTITPEEYADECVHLNVSSNFHASAKIKEGTLSGSIKETNNIGGIDLICATESWYDEKIVDEKISNAIIYQNLVKEQLETLPTRKLDKLKDAYNEIENEIVSFKSMLEQVQAGKAESINSLQYDFQKSEIYGNLQASTSSKTAEETFVQTGSAVAQAMFDLSQMQSFLEPPPQSQVHSQRALIEPSMDSLAINGYNPLSSDYFKLDVDSKGNRADNLWSKVVDATGVNVETISIQRETGNEAKVTIENPKLENLYNALHVDGTPVFSETGKLGEWYFDNVQRKFAGQDTTFASLNDFVNQFETKTSNLVKYAELHVTGGRGLLTVQAIMKSILELCQDQVDVSRYAPTKDNLSLFSYINRSPILGPVSTHPYPSRNFGNDREDIPDFSKTGFLSFPTIISMLQVCRAGRSEMIDIVKKQMQNYTTDYDDVLQLWFGTFLGKYTKQDAKNKANTLTDTEKSVFWTYFSGEELSHTQPAIDAGVMTDTAGRSFVNWNKEKHATIRYPSLQTNRNQQPYKSMMWNINSGGRGGASTIKPKGRGINTVVNFGLDTDLGAGIDVTSFFDPRKYNMVFSYASTVSIWKAICTKTLENMLDSINDITGESFQSDFVSSMLENEELVENLVMCIADVAYELYFNSGLSFTRGPQYDGSMNITHNVPNEIISGYSTKQSAPIYQNTPGPRPDDIGKLYLDFVGGISKGRK